MRLFFFGPRLFGFIRPGISLGAEDFMRFADPQRTTTTTAGSTIDPDHAFVYVIKNGKNGLVKIGRTRNPSARLAALQNEFSTRLEFAWIGAPKADVIAIERETHKMLDKYRRNGEWFAIEPDAAVGAIHSVAYRRGQPVLDLDAAQAEQIRLIACQPARKPSTVISRVAVGILQLLLGFAIAIAFIIFIFVRLGRL